MAKDGLPVDNGHNKRGNPDTETGETIMKNLYSILNRKGIHICYQVA